MAVVIPTTFVSDAMSHKVCSSGWGLPACQSMTPKPPLKYTRSWLPTTAYAPGNALSASACRTTWETES